MAHIVATRPLIEGGLSGLRNAHTVTICDPPNGSTRSVDELVALTDKADVLLSILADPVTERLFEARPSLRMVAQYAVGVDNIDLEAAEAHDVAVTHTPGVLTDATADMAWASVSTPGVCVTTLLMGMELSRKTIGIVGLGRIGAAVARRALGFGMEVVYHNRHRANPTVERQVSAQYVDLDELLATSDVVSLHCPHNEESHHLIDAEALGTMKSSALLVNTARGPVVDEAALVEALEEREIAGAGLDVFEEEPDVHPGLLEQDRVVLAPHLGSATTDARMRMAQMCVASIKAFLDDAESVPHRLV